MFSPLLLSGGEERALRCGLLSGNCVTWTRNTALKAALVEAPAAFRRGRS